MSLLIGIALFMVAMLWSVWLRRAENAVRIRAEAEARAEIARTGLIPSGNILKELRLDGCIHGVEVSVENRTNVTPPGSSNGEQVDACIARVAAPLEDQLVCRTEHVDGIMGPLPTARRIRTGNSSFDACYSVFMGLPRQDDNGSYRDPLDTSGIPWAQEAILDTLRELDLRWLRVQEGRLELVLPALEVKDIGRAVALAACIVHATARKPIPLLARGPRTVYRRRSELHISRIWTVGLFFAVPSGALLSIYTQEHALADERIGVVVVFASVIVLVWLAIVTLGRPHAAH